MFKKFVLLGFVLSCLAFVAQIGVAGARSYTTVTVGTDWANGAFRPTMESGDSTQYIGCSYYAYDTGSESATCYARDAAGNYISCFTGDAKMLRSVQTLSSHSYLYFVVNSDGSCDRVITVNASYEL